MSARDPHVFEMTPISTPCVNVCRIDPGDDLCVGCARTPDEIARWLVFDDAQRAAIMALAPRRRVVPPGKTEP
jgi:predicted Fe-S protein YdhL (DUF1289 family)